MIEPHFPGVVVSAMSLLRTSLVCYGTANFHHSVRRLARSAYSHGIDQVRCWDRYDLEQTQFYRLHRDILDLPRGGGYWLWKPFIIYEALKAAQPGDILFYADAGVEVTGDLTALVRLCYQKGGVLLFDGPYDEPDGKQPHIGRRWTKRDCFVYMDCDAPRFHDARVLDASFLVLMKCDRALSLIREWLLYCAQRAILTDDPNRCSLPNLPEFRDHRHDQSVLSLLAARDHIELFRNPSQIANYQKPPALREPGEPLTAPYGTGDLLHNSPYPTLLNHHRSRSFPTLLADRREELAPVVRKNRAALRKIERWVTDRDYQRALVGFGLPPHVRSLIDAEQGDDPTYVDWLLHLSQALPRPVRCLELGVGVGKTLWQACHFLRGAHITAFDIEDINPTLKRHLGATRLISRWPTMEGSLRKAGSHLHELRGSPNRNQVRYLCGDIHDEAAWKHLAGQRFNLLFSDAVHSPDALRFEFEMLSKYDLIDGDAFVMLWDDLGGAMTDAFWRIWRALKERHHLHDDCMYLGLANGWLGKNEGPHLVGLVQHTPEG